MLAVSMSLSFISGSFLTGSPGWISTCMGTGDTISTPLVAVVLVLPEKEGEDDDDESDRVAVLPPVVVVLVAPLLSLLRLFLLSLRFFFFFFFFLFFFFFFLFLERLLGLLTTEASAAGWATGSGLTRVSGTKDPWSPVPCTIAP